MEYQIDAATHLRKILSVERDPPRPGSEGVFRDAFVAGFLFRN